MLNLLFVAIIVIQMVVIVSQKRRINRLIQRDLYREMKRLADAGELDVPPSPDVNRNLIH